MTEGPSRPALMRENEQLRAEIERLRSAQSGVTVRVEYVDNPDHVEMIRQLQTRISQLQGVQR